MFIFLHLIRNLQYRSKNFNCLVYLRKNKDPRHTLTIGSVYWLNLVSVLSETVWTQISYKGKILSGCEYIQVDDCSNRPWFCLINPSPFILMIASIHSFSLTIFTFSTFHSFCYQDSHNSNNRRNFKFNRMADNPTETWCGCILISACDNFHERTALR